MTELTTHKTIVYLASFEDSFLGDDSNVRFSCGVPDPGESQPRVRDLLIRKELWVELGQPDALTITVEPGDTLNEAE